MILISVAYILDYINNEKFSYEALTFYNNTNNEEEKININKDDELNPYLNFTLSITSRYKDKLVVHDINNDIYLEKDNMDIYGRSYFNLRRKITDIDLGIYYICAEEKIVHLIINILMAFTIILNLEQQLSSMLDMK